MDIGKGFLALDEKNDGYWLSGEMDEGWMDVHEQSR